MKSVSILFNLMKPGSVCVCVCGGGGGGGGGGGVQLGAAILTV